MPLNKKYPIAELLDACRTYPGASNARRITFEYVMLKGVNDSPAEARELVRLLDGIPAKVNLIPFNPVARRALTNARPRRRSRVFGDIVNRRRLCLAGAHAARPRHHRRLRPAQIGQRQAAPQRARAGPIACCSLTPAPSSAALACSTRSSEPCSPLTAA